MGLSSNTLQSPQDLRKYYEARSWEGGFPARCHMELPRRSLSGKRILNVGCRRGKGTYKLSELVGPTGFVVGIDWNGRFIEAAQAGIPKALERSHLPRCNMEFREGFPEDLGAAGVGEDEVDIAYLNASLTLFADPPRALRECYRALAPTGTLLVEMAVAAPGTGKRAPVVQAARDIANAVQAAPTRAELMGWLVDAGFQAPLMREDHPVRPDRGSVFDHRVPTVEGDDAAYRLIAFEARKPK